MAVEREEHIDDVPGVISLYACSTFLLSPSLLLLSIVYIYTLSALYSLLYVTWCALHLSSAALGRMHRGKELCSSEWKQRDRLL